jgi:hypothetical protein
MFIVSKRKDEKPKLANQGELEAARTDQPFNPNFNPCPYNELHSDGTIAICKLKRDHEGNHELVPANGNGATQVTYTFTFRVGPGPQ